MSKLETGLSLIFGPMFSGKCVDPHTLIMGADGFFREAHTFKQGDKISTTSGLHKIVKVVKGIDTMYTVKTKFHEVICTPDHFLCLMDENDKRHEIKVKTYLMLSDKRKQELFMYKHCYPGKRSNNEKIRAFNSYEAGLTFIKDHIFNYTENDEDTQDIINIATSSIKSRLSFIIGCIDKFGFVENNHYHIPVGHEQMQTYVINSLGGTCEIYEDDNAIKYLKFQGGRFIDIYTKKGTIKGDTYSRTPFTITGGKMGPYVGIQLDRNHKMFDSHFYVLHNSTELIRQVKRFNLSGKRVLVLKSNIDDRYSAEPQVITHDKTVYDCLKIDDLKTVYDPEQQINIAKDYDVIAIDEGQFIKNLYIADELAVSHYVIIAGLDADFKKNSFKNMVDLIPKAEHVTKLSAICKCGKEAFFTKKLVTVEQTEYDQVSVGGAEQYIPTCRKCHK